MRIVKRYSFHDRRKGYFSLTIETSNGGLQTTATATATQRRKKENKRCQWISSENLNNRRKETNNMVAKRTSSERVGFVIDITHRGRPNDSMGGRITTS